MPFNSPLFLFLFLPALLAAYALAPRRLRTAVALVASILFYAWGEPKFVAVVVASALLDWLAAKRIADCGGTLQAKWTLFGGVAVYVVVLLNFKFTGILVTNTNSVGALLHLRPMPVPD